MDTKEIVLAIADGTLSVSRIKRIAKAAYGVELNPKVIGQITDEAGIATPRREPTGDLRDAYPDKWSILLEARSFWVRVRRYWGDDAALALEYAVRRATAEQWRGLSEQFGAYTTPAIRDRASINLTAVSKAVPQLESLYSWELQRDLYLQGFEQEFAANPEPKTGAKFPLPTAEWEAFKVEQYRQDSIKVFDREIGSEEKLIEFFAEFWQEVYRNRGDRYFENLRHSFVGSGQSVYQHPFYSATQNNFRHFLHNLNGFRTKAPWRVVVMQDPEMPLPMLLEGALAKYGWKKVQSMAAIAILSVTR